MSSLVAKQKDFSFTGLLSGDATGEAPE